MTIFFKKVALALLHRHCTAAAVAAPTQEAAALARRQPLCQGAAIPTAGTSTGAAPSSAAAAGGRPCRRQPLRAVPLPAGCLPTGAEPEVGYPLRAGRGRPEIVYPCIPDPVEEDEGGQASSSLAYPHDESLQRNSSNLI
ncbi:hypothetical protein BHM03_00044145 [Ensete ventricosum]|nr:hypothetical protein BHM03_00044145 [Ensete ventricosum]